MVLAHRAPILVIVALVLAAGATGVAAARTSSPCDVQSAYYCIPWCRASAARTAAALYLDNLFHSYVDLKDPTFISLEYENAFTDVLSVAYPDTATPLRVVHVGGGGFTLPRWVEATYPASRNLVLEIDPAVRDLARKARPEDQRSARVEIGDGRQRYAQSTNSADVVVGDAFASLSVPWHLTTREYVADVDRVLRRRRVPRQLARRIAVPVRARRTSDAAGAVPIRGRNRPGFRVEELRPHECRLGRVAPPARRAVDPAEARDGDWRKGRGGGIVRQRRRRRSTAAGRLRPGRPVARAPRQGLRSGAQDRQESRRDALIRSGAPVAGADHDAASSVPVGGESLHRFVFEGDESVEVVVVLTA